jgi:hypothetical protein
MRLGTSHRQRRRQCQAALASMCALSANDWLREPTPVKLSNARPLVTNLRDEEQIFGQEAACQGSRLCGTYLGRPVTARDYHFHER